MSEQPFNLERKLKDIRRFAAFLNNRGSRSLLVRAYLAKHPNAGEVALVEVNELIDLFCGSNPSELTMDHVVDNAPTLVALAALAHSVDKHSLGIDVGFDFTTLAPSFPTTRAYLKEYSIRINSSIE